MSFSDMQPEMSIAVGVIGDTRDVDLGQEISVLYRDFGVYAQNVAAERFELVRRDGALPGNRP